MRFHMLAGPALLALAAAAGASAHEDEVPINLASELRDWCKQESEAYFVGKGATPMNWTASYTESGNTLKVAGKWRVNSNDVAVECHAPRGAQRRYAKMEVHE